MSQRENCTWCEESNLFWGQISISEKEVFSILKLLGSRRGVVTVVGQERKTIVKAKGAIMECPRKQILLVKTFLIPHGKPPFQSSLHGQPLP